VAGWAFALMVVYMALAFGVRVGVALRTTGSTGIARFGGAPPIEVLGGGLFGTALVAGAINPPLALDGAIDTIADLDSAGFHAAGFVLAGAGIAGTFASQLAMGDSWRIGVDQDERTELVTDGVFALVRNPIYSFMVIAWIGFALMVPTWLSLASVPVGIAGIWIQVRLVEEPHLIAGHGDAFRAYASRVGRFVPGLGRLGGPS
jgi:protein-S-isoprenylcysteine O-methyltransferase Ste14